MQTACGPRGRCTLPPKRLPNTGCWAQWRGALNTPGLSPAVPSSPTWAKPRCCRSSSCHGVVGTRVHTPAHTHAEVAHAVHRHRSCAWTFPRARLGQPQRHVCALLLGHPENRSSAAAGLQRALRTREPHGHGPGSQPAALRAKPHSWGTERAAVVPAGTPLPPQRLGLAGVLGCCRVRPRCLTPALQGALMPGSSPDLGQGHWGEGCPRQPALLKVKEED